MDDWPHHSATARGEAAGESFPSKYEVKEWVLFFVCVIYFSHPTTSPFNVSKKHCFSYFFNVPWVWGLGLLGLSVCLSFLSSFWPNTRIDGFGYLGIWGLGDLRIGDLGDLAIGVFRQLVYLWLYL